MDQPGIIAALSGILAAKHIGIEAVLQLPHENKLEFLLETPLVLPMEPPL